VSAILLKLVHIAGIALWSGGLLCLPLLYVQRRSLTGSELHRLHNFTRFFYVKLVSPAAFVAIVSGTVLIFVQATFEPWFSLKLALVAVMVLIHVMSGLVILRLFGPDQGYPKVRFVAVTLLTSAVVGAILFIVLAKPQWLVAGAVTTFFSPGALGDMLGQFTAWWK
jgi:putative membrane protein